MRRLISYSVNALFRLLVIGNYIKTDATLILEISVNDRNLFFIFLTNIIINNSISFRQFLWLFIIQEVL